MSDGRGGLAGDDLGSQYAADAHDKSLPPKQREAARLFSVAEAHLNEEEDEAALRVSKQALEMFRELRNENAMADCVRVAVHALCYQEKRKEANKMAREELERIRAGRDRRGEAKILLAIAEVNAERRGNRNREEALLLAEEARELLQKRGDVKMEGHACLTLLNIHMKRRGDKLTGCQQALAWAVEARSLFRSIGDRRGEAMALHGIAVAHVRADMNGLEIRGPQGGWVAASDEAARIFAELGLRKMEAFERVCIAHWYLSTNPRKALKLAEDALKRCQDIGSLQEPAAVAVLVQAHLALKDTSEMWKEKEAQVAVQIAKDGLARFRAKGDRHGEAQALNALILAYMAKDDQQEALYAAEEASDIFRELGDKGGESMALQTVAQIQLKRSQPEKALKAAQEVTDLAVSLHETAVAQETVYEVYLRRRDYKEAFKVADQLRILCEEAGDSKREAIARLMVSNVHFSQQEYGKAVSVAREAQALLHDLGAKAEEASALRSVAEAYAAMKDFEPALKAAERSRRLYKSAGKEDSEVSALLLVAQIRLSLLNQGSLKAQRGTPAFASALAEAAKAADAAAAAARERGKEKLVASALCAAAQIQLCGLQCDEAQKTADEAMAIYRGLSDQRNIANVMCIEADIHLVNGNNNKALMVANKAMVIFREQGDVRGEWVANKLLERIIGPPEGAELPKSDWEEYQRWKQQQQHAHQGIPQAVKGHLQRQRQREEDEARVAKKPFTGGQSQRLDMSKSVSIEAVQNRLQDIIKTTLDEDIDLELDQPLMAVGITSKSAVALRNALADEVPGVNLPFTLVFDYPSVNAISELIVENAQLA